MHALHTTSRSSCHAANATRQTHTVARPFLPTPLHNRTTTTNNIAPATLGALSHVLCRRSEVLGQRVVVSAQQTDATSEEMPTAVDVFKVLVTSNGLNQSLLLETLADGLGQAIVITGVLEDSAADKAGILPGMKVLAVSDPVRDGDMFEMNDRPSLRFVRDSLRLRRTKPVEIWLQRNFITAASEPPVEPVPAWVKDEEPKTMISSLDDLLSDGSSSDDNGPTVANDLADRYEETLRQKRANNEVRQRIERRQARMEEDEKRDDSGLIGGLLVAFLGPAAVILAVASGSGYLDNMYLTSLAGFGN